MWMWCLFIRLMLLSFGIHGWSVVWFIVAYGEQFPCLPLHLWSRGWFNQTKKKRIWESQCSSSYTICVFILISKSLFPNLLLSIHSSNGQCLGVNEEWEKWWWLGCRSNIRLHKLRICSIVAFAWGGFLCFSFLLMFRCTLACLML